MIRTTQDLIKQLLDERKGVDLAPTLEISQGHLSALRKVGQEPSKAVAARLAALTGLVAFLGDGGRVFYAERADVVAGN